MTFEELKKVFGDLFFRKEKEKDTKYTPQTEDDLDKIFLVKEYNGDLYIINTSRPGIIISNNWLYGDGSYYFVDEMGNKYPENKVFIPFKRFIYEWCLALYKCNKKITVVKEWDRLTSDQIKEIKMYLQKL